MKIISKVSDVLGSAIGYELHGSEFVKRLRSANVIESTSRIENEIITRNSIIRGFEITIRENISKVDHLKALESISKTKNNKYINLANNLQKTIDNMEIELKRQTESLKQHINKLEEIKAEFEPIRLEQEITLLAQKADVDEELDRLNSHLQEAKRVLDSSGQIGRRLDFLMQELNREANTLSSKSIVVETTQSAVELKVLIEQMREQIQNIE